MDGEEGYPKRDCSRYVSGRDWALVDIVHTPSCIHSRLRMLTVCRKYTSYGKTRQAGRYPGIAVNYAGNHSKNLRVTVEESLKRLRTDYIDLLYVHWDDHSTSIPELMQSLNDMVRSGKVLYLGISDTSAWKVSQANEYARQNGMAQFAVL